MLAPLPFAEPLGLMERMDVTHTAYCKAGVLIARGGYKTDEDGQDLLEVVQALSRLQRAHMAELMETAR